MTQNKKKPVAGKMLVEQQEMLHHQDEQPCDHPEKCAEHHHKHNPSDSIPNPNENNDQKESHLDHLLYDKNKDAAHEDENKGYVEDELEHK